jgi:hypothetical protein
VKEIDMSQFPPPVPQPGTMMRPHRGTMILVFGILGFVICVIFGVVAWVMGNADLKEMDAGRMDPSGRSLTNAGKICGMIATILNIVLIAIYIVLIVIGIGAAAAGGAGGAGGGFGP